MNAVDVHSARSDGPGRAVRGRAPRRGLRSRAGRQLPKPSLVRREQQRRILVPPSALSLRPQRGAHLLRKLDRRGRDPRPLDGAQLPDPGHQLGRKPRRPGDERGSGLHRRPMLARPARGSLRSRIRRLFLAIRPGAGHPVRRVHQSPAGRSTTSAATGPPPPPGPPPPAATGPPPPPPQIPDFIFTSGPSQQIGVFYADGRRMTRIPPARTPSRCTTSRRRTTST